MLSALFSFLLSHCACGSGMRWASALCCFSSAFLLYLPWKSVYIFSGCRRFYLRESSCFLHVFVLRIIIRGGMNFLFPLGWMLLGCSCRSVLHALPCCTHLLGNITSSFIQLSDVDGPSLPSTSYSTQGCRLNTVTPMLMSGYFVA